AWSRGIHVAPHRGGEGLRKLSHLAAARSCAVPPFGSFVKKARRIVYVGLSARSVGSSTTRPIGTLGGCQLRDSPPRLAPPEGSDPVRQVRGLRPFVVAREPVVRDVLPRRRVGDE